MKKDFVTVTPDSGDVGDVNSQIVSEGNISNNERKEFVNYISKGKEILRQLKVKQKGGVNLPNGVYIQDIDGYFWKKEEWVQPNENAVGLLILDDRHPNGGFLLGKNNLSSKWSTTSSLVSGVTTNNDVSQIINDYKGYENTQAIIAASPNDNSAAKLCTEQTINGNPGYLGSAGEWEIVLRNNTDVEECLAKIGAESISSGAYFTSSQYDASNTWKNTMPNCISKSSKNDNWNVRVFGNVPEWLKPATIIFDKSMSDPANITGDVNQKAIAEIVKRHRRCLCKKTAEGEVAICYLKDDDSTKYHDGTSANLDGTEGDVMVVRPEFWYKWAKVDNNRFSETFDIKEIADGIHADMCLIGAYKARMFRNKLYSRSDVPPTANKSWNDFNTYATARGKGYSMIDFEQHCMIALVLYAKYGNRNMQAVLGTGGAIWNPITKTGTTNTLGNQDTVKSNSNGYVNGLGIEGVFGGIYEWVKGVEINNRVWKITDPDGSTRKVNAGTSNGWITNVAAENGPFFDMVPTQIGGSETTHYSDYYYQSSNNALVLARSCDGSSTVGGVAFAFAYYGASYTSSYYGSRLAFRGKISVIDNVEEFKALPVL